MGRKKNSASSMGPTEKMQDPIAKNLQVLVTEPKRLSEHLGCSVQAVNQYRLGLSRPSLENLGKIADFYEVTTDFLLGRTDEKTVDVNRRAACDYTGLTPEAASYLHEQSSFNTVYRRIDAINFLIENEHFQAFLDMFIGFATSKEEILVHSPSSNGLAPVITDSDAFFTRCNSLLMLILQDSRIAFAGEDYRDFYRMFISNYIGRADLQEKYTVEEFASEMQAEGLPIDRKLLQAIKERTANNGKHQEGV